MRVIHAHYHIRTPKSHALAVDFGKKVIIRADTKARIKAVLLEIARFDKDALVAEGHAVFWVAAYAWNLAVLLINGKERIAIQRAYGVRGVRGAGLRFHIEVRL